MIRRAIEFRWGCESEDDQLCYFFFQAEDGIRELVRFRGLGDLYEVEVLVLVLKSTVRLMLSRVMKVFRVSCRL